MFIPQDTNLDLVFVIPHFVQSQDHKVRILCHLHNLIENLNFSL